MRTDQPEPVADGTIDRFDGADGRSTALESIAAGARRRDALLGLRPGYAVVDVGCGTGADAVALADLVAPHGRVVGVDAGSALLEAARTRAARAGAPVEFVAASGHALPFAQGTFDAGRCECALAHVVDPGRSVAELARVIRRGGTVVVTEPDWGTLVVDATDNELARAAARGLERAVRNGWIGRSLRRLLMEAGLDDIRLIAEPVLLDSLDLLRPTADLPGFAVRAARDGLLDTAEVGAFVAELEQAGRTGRFTASITLFTAVGRVR